MFTREVRVIVDEEKERESRAWVAMLIIWLRWPLRQALRLWCWLTDEEHDGDWS